MTPILAKAWENLTKHVTFSNCAINIRNDNFFVVLPKEYSAFYSLSTLQSRRNCKRNFVLTRLKVKLLQLFYCRSETFLITNFCSFSTFSLSRLWRTLSWWSMWFLFCLLLFSSFYNIFFIKVFTFLIFIFWFKIWMITVIIVDLLNYNNRLSNNLIGNRLLEGKHRDNERSGCLPVIVLVLNTYN